MSRNIPGDIFIGGNDANKIATIETPQGFKTEIEGTVDIIDRVVPATGNDVGRLLVNGKTVFDTRTTHTVNNANDPLVPVRYTIKEDDDIIICQFDKSKIGNIELTLPKVSDVHPKVYTIIGKGNQKSQGRGLYWLANGHGSTTPFTGADWYDGQREIVPASAPTQWHATGYLSTPGSITIQTQLGQETSAPVGSGDNWVVVSSHNTTYKQHIYLEEVQVASDLNEDLSDLIPGYSMNGYDLVEGDRILLRNQSDKIENGIYDVLSDGVVRSPDMAHGDQAATVLVHTNTGYLLPNKTFRITNIYEDSIVGTDPLEVINTSIANLRTDVVQTVSPTSTITTDGEIGTITTLTMTTASHTKTTFTLQPIRLEQNDFLYIWLIDYDGSSYPVIGQRGRIYPPAIEIDIFNAGSVPLDAPLTIGYCIIPGPKT